MNNLQLAAIAKVFSILERRFPERLCAINLLDASRLFHACYNMVQPFIDV